MPLSLRLLPSSVCGSISPDKIQPGGGTDVALTSIWALYPDSASHSRCSVRAAYHSRPLVVRGKEKSSPPSVEITFAHVLSENDTRL